MSFFDNWLILGLVAAFFYGAAAVMSKVVIGDKFLAINPKAAALLMFLGSAIVIAIFFFSAPTKIPTQPMLIGAGLLYGILLTIGNVIVYIALEKHANIAQLAPIYNVNTLIAVVLGIILLAEIPNQAQAVKILIGAILIIIGSIFVTG